MILKILTIKRVSGLGICIVNKCLKWEVGGKSQSHCLDREVSSATVEIVWRMVCMTKMLKYQFS